MVKSWTLVRDAIRSSPVHPHPVLVVELGGTSTARDAIRSTPGASPLHLGGRTGRDEYDDCVSKGQAKSDQEGKAFGVKSVGMNWKD